MSDLIDRDALRSRIDRERVRRYLQTVDTKELGAGTDAVLDYLDRCVLPADGTYRDDVPPGICGAPYPYAEVPYSCELLAGHRGMHQCKDWRSIPPGQIGTPQIAAWTKA